MRRPETRTAVVAGGGLGGLSAAVALHLRGWQVTVLEQAPSLEPVGAGISLWPNALRALDVLGLGSAVRAQATLSGPGGIRHPDGRWLTQLDLGAAITARFGDPLVLVHRAELVDLLVGRLSAGVVRTGTTVLGVSVGDGDRRASVMTTGGELSADVVVAADGIRSVLREAVVSGHGSPRYAGYTAWRMVVPRPDGTTTGFETWGRDGLRFAVFPLSAERLYCYATATAPVGARSRDEKAELVRLFCGWHEPIPQIVAGLRSDQILHQDIEELVPPLPGFARGRVVLIGDAAHAMTPELGQGGCLAIEDAVVLASVLDSEPSIAAALQRYTALRLPRTSSLALRSRRAGRLHQLPYPVQVLAARAMGLVPDAAVARVLGPVVDWHPPGVETFGQNRPPRDRF
jgi:2-polyprenyl-6-methoxyphenol hydroxylase-like FAD-dependent oxidoreductase